ncbi:MAG TPA: ribokinase [Kineosporiaceae bacterium]|nr:ribokinase [Kineosporiaceae bacterium]
MPRAARSPRQTRRHDLHPDHLGLAARHDARTVPVTGDLTAADRAAARPGRSVPPDVLVIGSANADLVVAVDRRPAAGETVLGGDLVVQPGGKGANQAVAAARLGARAAFAGCLGDDAHGDLLLASLTAAGVDVTLARRLAGVPTGVALISVTPDGDNAIIVSPGANAQVGTGDVERALRTDGGADGGARVVVLQLELPPPVVAHAAVRAAGAGARVVLNPAPPAPLPPAVLAVCDPLVLNAHEAGVLLGLRGPAGPGAADALLALGPRSVVLTLGAGGAVVADPAGTTVVAAPRVTPVDTTGAGDALIGALAWRLVSGDGLVEAVRFAVRVASTATLRPGAQPSFPHPDEVLPAGPDR